jgi:hypothetical protein
VQKLFADQAATIDKRFTEQQTSPNQWLAQSNLYWEHHIIDSELHNNGRITTLEQVLGPFESCA